MRKDNPKILFYQTEHSGPDMKQGSYKRNGNNKNEIMFFF